MPGADSAVGGNKYKSFLAIVFMAVLAVVGRYLHLFDSHAGPRVAQGNRFYNIGENR